MKRIALGVLACVALSVPAFAQSAPNRGVEVSGLVQGKYAGRLNGDDNVRREVLRGLCTDLNLLDGGRWGLLIKNDQGGRIPADILVWRPTREHFDVLSDFGPAWQADGPIPEAWGWIECGASVPPPVVVVPPTPAPSVDLNELIARVTIIQQVVADIRQQNLVHETADAAERQQAAEFREDVRSAWRDRFVFIGKYILPAVTGVLAGWKLP